MGKWKQVQRYASHIPSPLEHLKKMIGFSSGILVLDATFVYVLGKDTSILIAYDTGLGVVDYLIGSKEKKEGYSCILERLKEVGYEPLCVVSDGHVGLVSLIQEKGYSHQRCVVHLLWELERLLGGRRDQELRGRNREIYFLIRNIWTTKTIEEIPHRLSCFQKHKRLFRGKSWLLEWFREVTSCALTHLSFEGKVPYTTNILENMNGQIKQRLKTMRGMKSRESLHNLLKIFFYFKNYK